MRRNIKSKKTKKKSLYGGNNEHERNMEKLFREVKGELNNLDIIIRLLTIHYTTDKKVLKIPISRNEEMGFEVNINTITGKDIVITSVTSNTQADKAGIKVGDIICYINETDVRDFTDVERFKQIYYEKKNEPFAPFLTVIIKKGEVGIDL